MHTKLGFLASGDRREAALINSGPTTLAARRLVVGGGIAPNRAAEWLCCAVESEPSSGDSIAQLLPYSILPPPGGSAAEKGSPLLI